MATFIDPLISLAMSDTLASGIIRLVPLMVILLAASLWFLCHYSVAGVAPDARLLPPGPKVWPLVGSLVTMLRNKPHFRWLISVADGKDITCIRLGSVHLMVVNSPEIAREFLKKHDAVFCSRPLTMATEYNSRHYRSVATSPWGDQWKKMRRVVASEIMSTIKLRPQEILRQEEADNFTKYVYNRCNAGLPVDVRFAVRYYCGTVIRRMLFGVRHFGEGGEHGGPGKEEVEHVESAFDVLGLVYALCPSDFLPFLRCLDLGGHEKKVREATEAVYKYHDPIIDERLKKWKSWRDGVAGSTKLEVRDVLDAFLSLKDDDGRPLLDDEDIRAQSADLVYAVVDNPSNTAEWALAEMMNNPEILERAVEELDRVVGKDHLVQESDFANLPYLKACAREILRLHSVSPMNLPHVAISDATVSGYFMPKGSWVLLNRVGLGRNPKVWVDPHRFDPERHLKEEVELAEPELRFITFTTGRRGCMGGPLGSALTYMLLARLLQAFEWTLPPGTAAVDLSEETKSLFLGRRLMLCARPRLPKQVFQNI